MADARLDIVGTHMFWNVATNRVRSLGLANAGHIVEFAFDGHQRDGFDRFWIYRPPTVFKYAAREMVFLKDAFDGLEIKLFAEVQDGEIFIIEFAVLFSTVAIACYKMVEEFFVGIDMIVPVHIHERGELDLSLIHI